MSFKDTTKVREIATADPRAKRVLDEAGIDYCCGGEKSLHDACMHTGASSEEILKRLEQNSKQVEPQEANWALVSLSVLTQHIREKHHTYVRDAIPRLRALAAKVKAKHSLNHPELAEIEQQLFDLGQELYMHMQKEEQILFPYIEAMERSGGKGTLEPPFFQTVRNPVHMMMKEHDSAGEALHAIQKSSSAYQAPADGCESYRELYRTLGEFEADLRTHIHLENNILFPRAIELEAAML